MTLQHACQHSCWRSSPSCEDRIHAFACGELLHSLSKVLHSMMCLLQIILWRILQPSRWTDILTSVAIILCYYHWVLYREFPNCIWFCLKTGVPFTQRKHSHDYERNHSWLINYSVILLKLIKPTKPILCMPRLPDKMYFHGFDWGCQTFVTPQIYPLILEVGLSTSVMAFAPNRKLLFIQGEILDVDACSEHDVVRLEKAWNESWSSPSLWDGSECRSGRYSCHASVAISIQFVGCISRV